ncbi:MULTISPECIES: carbohydrate ABC transporter permease [Cohnella]|uniref:Multiple sugar transport system permease protein/raffinose/stachyose/melibiose transport system permease protein n=1 Tax=Cohnella phaseoli TaxID=456490 RepID=A0A3D9IFP2_9BACL|nr:carbohydrate ABC transporter permease [Cohnella phaseoli]RED60568.1 multiple sugar transport system permease protein/raffinose/stachyose/melibiose transport system permease protein [Cohnella phaseoli]
MTKAKTGALYGLLLLWSFLCLYPLLWMVGASLKAPMDVMSTFSLFPQGKWHWETYAEVWNRLNFFSYFWNSVIVTLSTLIGINVLYSMAAFAFAKLRFPGNNALFVLFLGMMFVPGITVMVPLYLTENYLGILNTYIGLILPSINGAAPMAIFLFRNYFRSIPHELFESAKMEGAGIMRTLLQIYLPLSVPILATLTAINFLGSWNSLILPMVILSDQSLFTLPIGVMLLDSGVFRQWNVLMAGALISIVPILLCFGFLQKYYIKGLSAGAVKA